MIIFNIRKFIELKDITYIKEIIRYPLAKAIDRINDKTCWYQLVCWACGYVPFLFVFNKNNLRQTCSEIEGAYCGKCIKTGRLKENRQNSKFYRYKKSEAQPSKFKNDRQNSKIFPVNRQNSNLNCFSNFTNNIIASAGW